MMNESLSALVSPVDASPLERHGDELTGAGGPYPIRNGIPRFVPADNYAAAFGIQWNDFRRTQLDSYTGIPLSEERLSRCFRGELERIRGKTILEVGSGAGRFTEVLLKHGANLHSVDYSSAVEANAANNGASPNLLLVQADARKPPFLAASYDGVMCLGVVQHTPDPEETITALWRMVKPGGYLVIDHYEAGWLHWTTSVEFYRFVLKRLSTKSQRRATDAITDFFFPIHWRLRNSLLAQRLLRRVSPVHFYYPHVPLKDRAMYYEWARLDTHDGTTDYYKHRRSPKQIADFLKELGAVDIDVRLERLKGNGVEAFCRKPAG